MNEADERMLRRLGFEKRDGKLYVVPLNQSSASLVMAALTERDRQRTIEVCGNCGDVLPEGVRFCISCAAPVPTTERTERL